MLKNAYNNKYKIVLGLMAVFLILGIWQMQRSTIKGTLVHLGRLANYKILQTGKVNGHTITTKLDAVWHRQEHPLSCEIAALKMAISVYGFNIPESELISRLDFDPTQRSGSIWGDPFQGFVGDIDGRMGVTGYGVYWDPIARVGNTYLRSEVVQFTPTLMAQHISEGRPVVFWGYFGRGARINWTTPGGRVINAVNGEHARTVVGYSGDVSNPEGFLVFDPIYGQQYWSTADLFTNAAPFDFMGVAVYPLPKWVSTPGDPTVWEISDDGTQKRGIAMNWEQFIEYSNNTAGVATFTAGQMQVFQTGPVISIN